jgi:hypothetical protein
METIDQSQRAFPLWYPIYRKAKGLAKNLQKEMDDGRFN